MRKAIPFIIAAIALGCPLAHAQPKEPQRSTIEASSRAKPGSFCPDFTARLCRSDSATRTVMQKGATAVGGGRLCR